MERLKALAAELKGIPLSARIVLLAIIPALCEEFFFRGFLFGSLLRSGAAYAVLGTAAFFALFHILSPSGLTPERFIPSLFLGVFLGLLRWRSRSVWPGVLMHATHNSVLLVAMEVPERFGFAVGGDNTVTIPRTVCFGAAVLVAIGLGLLVATRSRTVAEA
jgi:membrane protease YdiL (CAAX protease family)